MGTKRTQNLWPALTHDDERKNHPPQPQFMAWKLLLEPRLRKDEDRQAARDEEVWKEKAAERRRLGIGPPLRPSAENTWRLEQLYDDD